MIRSGTTIRLSARWACCWGGALGMFVIGCSGESSSRSAKTSEQSTTQSIPSVPDPMASSLSDTQCDAVEKAIPERLPTWEGVTATLKDGTCTMQQEGGSTISLMTSKAISVDLAVAGALNSKSATITPQTGLGVEAGSAIVRNQTGVAWRSTATSTFWFVLIASSDEGSSAAPSEGEVVDIATAVAERI